MKSYLIFLFGIFFAGVQAIKEETQQAILDTLHMNSLKFHGEFHAELTAKAITAYLCMAVFTANARKFDEKLTTLANNTKEYGIEMEEKGTKALTAENLETKIIEFCRTISVIDDRDIIPTIFDSLTKDFGMRGNYGIKYENGTKWTASNSEILLVIAMTSRYLLNYQYVDTDIINKSKAWENALVTELKRNGFRSHAHEYLISFANTLTTFKESGFDTHNSLTILLNQRIRFASFFPEKFLPSIENAMTNHPSIRKLLTEGEKTAFGEPIYDHEESKKISTAVAQGLSLYYLMYVYKKFHESRKLEASQRHYLMNASLWTLSRVILPFIFVTAAIFGAIILALQYYGVQPSNFSLLISFLENVNGYVSTIQTDISQIQGDVKLIQGVTTNITTAINGLSKSITDLSLSIGVTALEVSGFSTNLQKLEAADNQLAAADNLTISVLNNITSIFKNCTKP